MLDARKENNTFMMKKHLIYLIFTLLATTVLVTAQIYLILNYYETDIALYASGTSLPTVFNISLVSCVVIVITSLFVMKNENFSETLPTVKSFTVFASAMCGLILSASVLMGFYKILMQDFSRPVSVQEIFNFISLICAAIASAYFFVLALKTEPYKIQNAFFGLFIVIWAAFRLMTEYFDVTSPLNNPIKILHQISYIAIMMFFLYEAGYSADIKKPKLYAVGGYLAIIFTFTSSLPIIILNISKLKFINTNTFSYIVELCLAFFVLVRMLTLYKKVNKKRRRYKHYYEK